MGMQQKAAPATGQSTGKGGQRPPDTFGQSVNPFINAAAKINQQLGTNPSDALGKGGQRPPDAFGQAAQYAANNPRAMNAVRQTTNSSSPLQLISDVAANLNQQLGVYPSNRTGSTNTASSAQNTMQAQVVPSGQTMGDLGSAQGGQLPIRPDQIIPAQRGFNYNPYGSPQTPDLMSTFKVPDNLGLGMNPVPMSAFFSPSAMPAQPKQRQQQYRYEPVTASPLYTGANITPQQASINQDYMTQTQAALDRNPMYRQVPVSGKGGRRMPQALAQGLQGYRP